MRVGEESRSGQVWGDELALGPGSHFHCFLLWRGRFLGRKQPQQSVAMGAERPQSLPARLEADS